MPWWFRLRIRTLVALAVGVVITLLFALSPAFWDSALLAGWDAGVLAWLILTFAAIRGADAQQTFEQEQALEPETLRVLIVVAITAVAGLLGAVALSAHNAGRDPIAQHLHLIGGAIAVFLAWLLVHAEFGLYYARLYYDEVETGDSVAGASAAPAAFRKGLGFPDRELVDFWDFMYFSFTIAMCYQTSDVTVSAWWMRRVTLMHSILSFAFVLIILGFAVNAIGSVL